MGDPGRVVYEPTDVHHHVVRTAYGENGYGLVPIDHPQHFARSGTVIACGCGRTFVARDRLPGEMFPRWRREGWFERRRRTRRAARAR